MLHKMRRSTALEVLSYAHPGLMSSFSECQESRENEMIHARGEMADDANLCHAHLLPQPRRQLPSTQVLLVEAALVPKNRAA